MMATPQPAPHVSTHDEDGDDDNLDEIKPRLPQPTPYQTVLAHIKSKVNQEVVLWRSTKGTTVQQMKQNGTAGCGTLNLNAQPPSYEEAKQQAQQGGRLPEFTADANVTSFSWKHWLVVVRINTKYLTPASGSSHESGFACSPNAPVTVLATVDRTGGKPEDTKRINAS